MGKGALVERIQLVGGRLGRSLVKEETLVQGGPRE